MRYFFISFAAKSGDFKSSITMESNSFPSENKIKDDIIFYLCINTVIKPTIIGHSDKDLINAYKKDVTILNIFEFKNKEDYDNFNSNE